MYVWQFLVSVSKDNSSAAEILDSISRSVRVKPENLRLTEVSGKKTYDKAGPIELIYILSDDNTDSSSSSVGDFKSKLSFYFHFLHISSQCQGFFSRIDACYHTCGAAGKTNSDTLDFHTSFHFPQVLKGRFQQIFLPSQSLDAVSPSDMLCCFEVLSKDLAKERVVLLRVQQVITAVQLL